MELSRLPLLQRGRLAARITGRLPGWYEVVRRFPPPLRRKPKPEERKAEKAEKRKLEQLCQKYEDEMRNYYVPDRAWSFSSRTGPHEDFNPRLAAADSPAFACERKSMLFAMDQLKLMKQGVPQQEAYDSVLAGFKAETAKSLQRYRAVQEAAHRAEFRAPYLLLAQAKMDEYNSGLREQAEADGSKWRYLNMRHIPSFQRYLRDLSALEDAYISRLKEQGVLGRPKEPAKRSLLFSSGQSEPREAKEEAFDFWTPSDKADKPKDPLDFWALWSKPDQQADSKPESTNLADQKNAD